jgi:hypothetical protein
MEMREEKFHPTPPWSGILRRELLRVVVSGRGLAFLAMIATPSLILITIAARTSLPGFPAASTLAYPIFAIVAAIWPLILWWNEGWGKRDHRWSLPIDAATHDLARVALGWLVFVVAAAIVLATAIYVDLHGAIGPRTLYFSRPEYWVGIVLLPAILYLIGSASTLGLQRSAHGIWILYFVSFFSFSYSRNPSGLRFGLERLLDPVVILAIAPVNRIPPDSWVFAYSFGVLIAALCVLLTARRYERRSG